MIREYDRLVEAPTRYRPISTRVVQKQRAERYRINESPFQRTELAFLNHGTDDCEHEGRVVSALIHECSCLAAILVADLKVLFVVASREYGPKIDLVLFDGNERE